jgi:hypothetical protein
MTQARDQRDVPSTDCWDFLTHSLVKDTIMAEEDDIWTAIT